MKGGGRGQVYGGEVGLQVECRWRGRVVCREEEQVVVENKGAECNLHGEVLHNVTGGIAPLQASAWCVVGAETKLCLSSRQVALSVKKPHSIWWQSPCVW